MVSQKATSNCVEDKNLDGYVEVNVFGCVCFVSQLWTSVKNIIHSCNYRMIVLMKKFGISKDADISPFYENFKAVFGYVGGVYLLLSRNILNVTLMKMSYNPQTIHHKNKRYNIGYMIL